MSQKINLDGVLYDSSQLSQEASRLLEAYLHVSDRLQEAENMKAILTRAKNSYIAGLKSEIVQGRSGLNLSDLFNDD